MWKMSLERSIGSNAPAQLTSSLEYQNQTQDFIHIPYYNISNTIWPFLLQIQSMSVMVCLPL